MTRPPLRISPTSEVFVDARGAGRALKVTWHHEVGVVVLSLWRGNQCVGTLQLAAEEVPGAIAALADGLSAGYVAAPPGAVDAAGAAEETGADRSA
jgi:hypothetical protein